MRILEFFFRDGEADVVDLDNRRATTLPARQAARLVEAAARRGARVEDRSTRLARDGHRRVRVEMPR